MISHASTGYYKYKNITTASKFEVMQLADDVSDVTWHYNDEFFSKYKWVNEPAASLSQLYEARARKLREDYDYLVLMFSGGSDSSNILETFARNHIHLNEICCHTNLQGTGDPQNPLNEEVYNLAIPKATAYIKDYNMSTMLREYDITAATLRFFKNNPDYIHWVNNAGSAFTQAKPRAGTIFDTDVDEWKNLVTEGKKVAFIWGCDKPRVYGRDGKFFSYFTDIIDINLSIKQQVMDKTSGAVDELFYWSPTPEGVNIMIKQAHAVKRIFEGLINTNKLQVYQAMHSPIGNFLGERTSVYWDTKKGARCNLLAEDVKAVIYPYWNQADDYFARAKVDSNFLNTKDQWFYGYDEAKPFIKALEYFATSIKPAWIFKGQTMPSPNQIGIPKRIVKVNSKMYQLNY